MARNYMIGGIMGTGKSSATRNLLLGAMLDPLVDIDVYVMAFNADYDAMRPRLRTLVMGDDDEQIYAALQALRALRDDVTARGKILVAKGGNEMALTREQAKRDPRMRPRVVVFDEVHELFEHKTYGEEAAELAIKVLKKARKCGITLIFVTVSPTASSIPKDVTRNTSNRVAFAVGDHIANDGLLGTGKHKAGITATTLNPGEDIGTALTVGFTRNAFELVRMHFVEKSANADQITPIVARALALYLQGASAAIEQGETERADTLADVAAALGDEARVRTEEVVHRLKNRNPTEYGDWTTADLAAALSPLGAAPYKSNGQMVVSRQRVAEAIDDRQGGSQGGDREAGRTP
jgi:S-DNA-T family DNA segregation ATPase FtsK/SpoIIIE